MVFGQTFSVALHESWLTHQICQQPVTRTQNPCNTSVWWTTVKPTLRDHVIHTGSCNNNTVNSPISYQCDQMVHVLCIALSYDTTFCVSKSHWLILVSVYIQDVMLYMHNVKMIQLSNIDTGWLWMVFHFFLL